MRLTTAGRCRRGWITTGQVRWIATRGFSFGITVEQRSEKVLNGQRTAIVAWKDQLMVRMVGGDSLLDDRKGCFRFREAQRQRVIRYGCVRVTIVAGFIGDIGENVGSGG